MDALNKRKKLVRNIFILCLLITVAWWSISFIRIEEPSKLFIAFTLILAPLSTAALVGLVISATMWFTLSNKKTDMPSTMAEDVLNVDQVSKAVKYRRKAIVLTVIGVAVVLLTAFLTAIGVNIDGLGILLLFPPTLLIIVMYPLYTVYLWAKYFSLKS